MAFFRRETRVSRVTLGSRLASLALFPPVCRGWAWGGPQSEVECWYPAGPRHGLARREPAGGFPSEGPVQGSPVTHELQGTPV